MFFFDHQTFVVSPSTRMRTSFTETCTGGIAFRESLIISLTNCSRFRMVPSAVAGLKSDANKGEIV